ncbi:hypothetical protein QBC39DRAFT_341928 [Podospora conica]|nr:hypothetical protein QBC39DRAFT_341928 [Schizothecium conicum]
MSGSSPAIPGTRPIPQRPARQHMIGHPSTPSQHPTTVHRHWTHRPFPNIGLYASEASYASPLLADGDMVFGELSPPAPGFYPFVDSTGSDSPGDSLGDLTFPGFVPGPASVFPDFGASTGDDVTYATTRIQPQRQPSTNDPSMVMPAGLSPHKRARLTLEADRAHLGRGAPPRRTGANRPLQPAVPPPTSLAGSGQSIKPKLRSASSSSKNFAPRSTETAKERKERDSHNLVEKKYRNRLNAQYEGLMNILPPEMQSPTRATAAGSSGGSSDQAEKPLSKGEVLEKSTAYIQELERNHARLSEENEALSRNIDRLCSMFAEGGSVGDLGRPEG